jgi:nucleoside-diphosphate-sugar epimerase
MTLLAATEKQHVLNSVNLSRFFGADVLITGATGFFGSYIREILSDVANLTICNSETYQLALNNNYDMIFHFAPVDVAPVIECARRTYAKILYTSSGAVYGGVQHRVKETDECNPKTLYGGNKLVQENALQRDYDNFVIARPFAFCGRGLRNYFAITHFVEAAVHNKPLQVFNNGKAVRSYLYGVDAAIWFLGLMDKGTGIYNVGSEIPTSIKSLARLVSEQTGAKIEYVKDDFVEPAPYYLPNCQKAHELGLKQNYTLEYGLRRMIA